MASIISFLILRLKPLKDKPEQRKNKGSKFHFLISQLTLMIEVFQIKLLKERRSQYWQRKFQATIMIHAISLLFLTEYLTCYIEKSAKMENATSVNQLVMKIKLRHYTYFFVDSVKRIERLNISPNFNFVKFIFL
jgi:hypothetical protein